MKSAGQDCTFDPYDFLLLLALQLALPYPHLLSRSYLVLYFVLTILRIGFLVYRSPATDQEWCCSDLGKDQRWAGADHLDIPSPHFA